MTTVMPLYITSIYGMGAEIGRIDWIGLSLRDTQPLCSSADYIRVFIRALCYKVNTYSLGLFAFQLGMKKYLVVHQGFVRYKFFCSNLPQLRHFP